MCIRPSSVAVLIGNNTKKRAVTIQGGELHQTTLVLISRLETCRTGISQWWWDIVFNVVPQMKPWQMPGI